MRKLLYLLISMILVICCRTVPDGYHKVEQTNGNQKVGCSNIVKKVKKRWFKKNERLCYYQDIQLLKDIQESGGCFIGLLQTEIEGIFGSPSKIAENKFSYSCSLFCEEEDIFVPFWSLIFRTKKNVVTEIKVSGSPPPH